MFIKTSDLRHLDVISVSDGRYLGNVCDVDLDPSNGKLKALVLDKAAGPFRFLRSEEVIIQWDQVVIVGVDVVLVNAAVPKTNKKGGRR